MAVKLDTFRMVMEPMFIEIIYSIWYCVRLATCHRAGHWSNPDEWNNTYITYNHYLNFENDTQVYNGTAGDANQYQTYSATLVENNIWINYCMCTIWYCIQYMQDSTKENNPYSVYINWGRIFFNSRLTSVADDYGVTGLFNGIGTDGGDSILKNVTTNGATSSYRKYIFIWYCLQWVTDNNAIVSDNSHNLYYHRLGNVHYNHNLSQGYTDTDQNIFMNGDDCNYNGYDNKFFQSTHYAGYQWFRNHILYGIVCSITLIMIIILITLQQLMEMLAIITI